MRSVQEQVAELTRGVIDLHQLDELRDRLAEGRPLRIKAGFDPTRPDLHLGHAVLMRKMRQFQDEGHQIILLIGDFTAMLGDPTGRNELRPRLTKQQVVEAAATYQEQAFTILDRERTQVRYNSEWLGAMTLEQLLELAAKRTVARTLERRDFRERLDQGKNVFVHELIYPILQGYDSVVLEADVELGGTDQLFNLMVGRDLQGHYGQRPQVVMTTPILEGTDAKFEGGRIIGKKMSKSADNYIGLMEAPEEMYRKCMQIDDAIIWRYFELLSARSTAEIDAIKAQGNPLEAKALFAEEVIARSHGQQAVEVARKHFKGTYLGDARPENIPEVTVPTTGEGLLLAKAMNEAGLVKSTSEGRRMIQQGGVELDEQRVTDPNLLLGFGERHLVRVGSKNRRFAWIVVPPNGAGG